VWLYEQCILKILDYYIIWEFCPWKNWKIQFCKRVFFIMMLGRILCCTREKITVNIQLFAFFLVRTNCE